MLFHSGYLIRNVTTELHPDCLSKTKQWGDKMKDFRPISKKPLPS